jgi:Pentacotripeptide-repeat region of PRORP
MPHDHSRALRSLQCPWQYLVNKQPWLGTRPTIAVLAAGLPLTETAYTALARMAASAGDGAAALAAAQAMVAAGISPRLRSFCPALLAFSTAGQVRAAQPATLRTLVLLEPRDGQFNRLQHMMLPCHDYKL